MTKEKQQCLICISVRVIEFQLCLVLTGHICTFFPSKNFFIEVQLLSTVYQSDSVTHTPTHAHTHTYIILLKMFLSIIVYPKRLDLVP